MSNDTGYQTRENTGVLFYDAPGVPTLRGNIQSGSKVEIQAEPATDKNQTQYTKIIGEDVSGALYPNKYKKEDRHPDLTGPIKVKGKEMRVAAWKKTIKNGENAGNEFLSLSISEKQAGSKDN